MKIGAAWNPPILSDFWYAVHFVVNVPILQVISFARALLVDKRIDKERVAWIDLKRISMELEMLFFRV